MRAEPQQATDKPKVSCSRDVTPEIQRKRDKTHAHSVSKPVMGDWRLEPIKPLMKVGPSSGSEEPEERPHVDIALERIGFPGRRIRRRRLNSEEEGSLMRFGRDRVRNRVGSPRKAHYGAGIEAQIALGSQLRVRGELARLSKITGLSPLINKQAPKREPIIFASPNNSRSQSQGRASHIAKPTQKFSSRPLTPKKPDKSSNNKQKTPKGPEGLLKSMFDKMPKILKNLHFEKTKTKQNIMIGESNAKPSETEKPKQPPKKVEKSSTRQPIRSERADSRESQIITPEPRRLWKKKVLTDSIGGNKKFLQNTSESQAANKRDDPNSKRPKPELHPAPGFLKKITQPNEKTAPKIPNHNTQNKKPERKRVFGSSQMLYDHSMLTKHYTMNRKKSFDWEARRRSELNEAFQRSQDGRKGDLHSGRSESPMFNEPSNDLQKLVIPRDNCVNPLIWGGRGNNLRGKRGSVEIRISSLGDDLVSSVRDDKKIKNDAVNKKKKTDASCGKDGEGDPTKGSSFNTDNNGNGKNSEYMAMLFANGAQKKASIEPGVNQILAPTPISTKKRRGSGQDLNESLDFFKFHKRKTSFGGFGTNRKGSIAERSCYDNISELGIGLNINRTSEINVFKELNLNIGSQLSEASENILNDPSRLSTRRFEGAPSRNFKATWTGEDWTDGLKSVNAVKQNFRMRKDSEMLKVEHDVVKKVVEDLDKIEKELMLEKERGLYGGFNTLKSSGNVINSRHGDFMCEGQVIDFKGSDFSVIKKDPNCSTKRVKHWDPLKSPMSPRANIRNMGQRLGLQPKPFPLLPNVNFSFAIDPKKFCNDPQSDQSSVLEVLQRKGVPTQNTLLETSEQQIAKAENLRKKREADRRRRARNERERRRRAQRNREQKLLGKRESTETSWRVTEDNGGLLTKKQRRNKHSKKHMDFWIQNESDEEKTRRRGRRRNGKEGHKEVKTVIVLKKQTDGVGLKLKQRKRSNTGHSRDISQLSEYSHLDNKEDAPNLKKRKRNSRGSAHGKNSASRRKSNIKPNTLQTAKGSSNWNGNSTRARRESTKGVKTIQSERLIWNSRGACDESVKLKSKINKVKTYWAGTSLLVPNVFRHVCELEEEEGFLFEYLDLSRKELLVQANGQKAISQAGAPHLQRKGKKSGKKRRRNRNPTGASRRATRGQNANKANESENISELSAHRALEADESSFLGMTARQRRRAARRVNAGNSLINNTKGNIFQVQNNDLFEKISSTHKENTVNRKGDSNLSHSFAALWGQNGSFFDNNKNDSPNSRKQQNSVRDKEESTRGQNESQQGKKTRRFDSLKNNSILSALLKNTGQHDSENFESQKEFVRKLSVGLQNLKKIENEISKNQNADGNSNSKPSIFEKLINNQVSADAKQSQLLASNLKIQKKLTSKPEQRSLPSNHALKLEIQRVNKQLQDSLAEAEPESNLEANGSMNHAHSKASIEAFNNKLKILNKLLDEEEKLNANQSNQMKIANSDLESLNELKRLASFSQNVNGGGELTLKDLIGLQLSSPPRKGNRQCQSFSLLTTSKKIRKGNRRQSRSRRSTVNGAVGSRRKSGGFPLRRHFSAARKDSDYIQGLVGCLNDDEEPLLLAEEGSALSEGSVLSIDDYRVKIRKTTAKIDGVDLGVAVN